MIFEIPHENKKVIAISRRMIANKGILIRLSRELSGAKTKNKKYAMTNGTKILDSSFSTIPITVSPIAAIKNLTLAPKLFSDFISL